MAYSYLGRDANGKKQCAKYYLHRVITNCPDGLVVDHINHDMHDNRKSNLRIVEQKQNSQNRSGASNISSSGYRNVYWLGREKRWRACIKINGKQLYEKTFKDKEQANEYAIYLRKTYMQYATC